jgi:hypothetical protein
MRPATLPLFLLCCMGNVQGAHGQGTQSPGNPLPREVFPAGASLSWGLGPVSLQDEYISKERYSGSLPSLSLQWARFHERSGFRVEMDLATSSDVWSHQVSTAVTEFALDLDFLYPLGAVPIGSRRAFLFLGPSSGISILVNDQQIASHGMEVALSFASLFSLGAVCDGVFPISSRLTALGSFRVALVSAGLRMVDLMADQEESSLKLLSVLSGTRAVGSLGFRYRALDWVSVGLGYQGRLYRVTPWDPLISTRDHLTLTLVLGH